ncbi:uncharacterized protein LOC108221516 [Daucus carota subsp. sativus]|uniref:uncharacterized protein LOC108221516 n=1 Tax=Daucus carota subsp. sativus TaxID=79200 RepID=UPI0007F0352B|nr:PREDICTED: uncharacterized protein LOC108221516 [Daucus carota subsp. sativus]
MATKKYDSFSALTKTNTYFIVPTRVLNLWRGYRRTGEPFKGFNLLLLDHKRARIHAFVPYNLAEEFEPMIRIGNLYLLENFTIQHYKVDEKFRCLRMDFQIVFNEETEMNPREENLVNVENCWFDFFDIAELPTLSKQNTYLTDVVGIMEEHDHIRRIKNCNGVIQSQLIFEITDDRSSVRVTLWDDFARHFAESLKEAQEFPVILILGCARVTTWSEQVILTHVGATNFYINCNHRSVNELRKLLAQKKISTKSVCNENRRAMKYYKLDNIPTLGVDHAERQIFCKVKLTAFQQVKSWFQPTCTSCYAKTVKVEGQDTCTVCQRVVLYADNMFELYAIASDETGSMMIILEEREVKKLIAKTVSDITDEGNNDDSFPTILNTIICKEYTLKVRVQMDNILKKSEFYLVTDIMPGILTEGHQQPQLSIPHPIESIDAQPSSSACTNGIISTINLNS